MKKITYEYTIHHSETYSVFSEEERTLFKACKEAVKKAYAPYSNFSVGAALALEDGTIIQGNNQENAAYPSGLCAERVALFYASANLPQEKIKRLAVTINYDKVDTDDIIPPCGGCRQVIAEYEYKQKTPITIYLLGRGEKVVQIDSIKDILPFVFSGDVLKAIID